MSSVIQRQNCCHSSPVPASYDSSTPEREGPSLGTMFNFGEKSWGAGSLNFLLGPYFGSLPLPHLLSLFVCPGHLPSCHHIHIMDTLLKCPCMVSRATRWTSLRKTSHSMRRKFPFSQLVVTANSFLLLPPEPSSHFTAAPQK